MLQNGEFGIVVLSQISPAPPGQHEVPQRLLCVSYNDHSLYNRSKKKKIINRNITYNAFQGQLVGETNKELVGPTPVQVPDS
jgi:hypothetical protein